MSWQPIKTAPKKEGAEILAWFQKVKLDDDDNMTDEVIGGAMAHVARQGKGWTEPDWLDAHGSYFFEDWCFAPDPVLWHPLPPEPVAADYLGKTTAGVAEGRHQTLSDQSPMTAPPQHPEKL
jgi:hypothetical protein